MKSDIWPRRRNIKAIEEFVDAFRRPGRVHSVEVCEDPWFCEIPGIALVEEDEWTCEEILDVSSDEDCQGILTINEHCADEALRKMGWRDQEVVYTDTGVYKDYIPDPRDIDPCECAWDKVYEGAGLEKLEGLYYRGDEEEPWIDFRRSEMIEDYLERLDDEELLEMFYEDAEGNETETPAVLWTRS